MKLREFEKHKLALSGWESEYWISDWPCGGVLMNKNKRAAVLLQETRSREDFISNVQNRWEIYGKLKTESFCAIDLVIILCLYLKSIE